jgi:serine/threonine protein kinase
MDFGIAASLKDAQSRATGAPIAVSIHYASPEQINGERPSVSMDIYSLGCVFYEMLTGHPPFTQGDVLHQQLTKQPEPMAGVSPLLNQVVLGCLVKDPNKRPRSIEEIRAVLDGRRVAAPLPMADRTIRIARPVAAQRKWITAIWWAVGALVLSGAWLVVNPGNSESTQGTIQLPKPKPPSRPASEAAPDLPTQPDVSPAPKVDPAREKAAADARLNERLDRQRTEDEERKKAQDRAKREAEEREAEAKRSRARQFVAEGDDLAAKYDWRDAMAAYTSARNLDPSNSAANQGYARAEKNWRAECGLTGCK